MKPGQVIVHEFYPEALPNPVQVYARVMRWCPKCKCNHEKDYFWTNKGKTKGCGKYFKKGDLGKTGAGGMG